MRNYLFYIGFFLITALVNGQACPDLDAPLAGATNVAVDTSISWTSVPGVNGYSISIGTTPGGFDIVNNQSVGLLTTYTPPLGLPEATQIYVTIALFFINMPTIICPSQSFTTEDVTSIPECTVITSPPDGSLNVSVSTLINWTYAPRATGYRVEIGTAIGLSDLFNEDVGNVLFYDPPADLPFSTLVFVAVIAYNENGDAVGCSSASFTTTDPVAAPDCTQLINPPDGSMNVPLSPVIEWVPAPRATGYIVSIGTTPTNNSVLDNAVIFTTSTMVLEFDPNTTYFIKIIPFNDAGQAEDCAQESFSTILGCGPFLDKTTGMLVTLSPEIFFPDEVGICDNDESTRITADFPADGYRWFQVLPNGGEVLLSEEFFVDISEIGTYRIEAYNILTQSGSMLECADDQEFLVVSSSSPVIENIDIQEIGGFFYATVEVSGGGTYEYSFDSIEGPYSDLNSFSSTEEGTYTVYVRDTGGCGTVQQDFRFAFPTTGFPPYFSPNGDGINDIWEYVPPAVNPLRVQTIYIYDRFGKVLYTFGPNFSGWDGRYKSKEMPADGYWYRAVTRNNGEVRGYFSLVR